MLIGGAVVLESVFVLPGMGRYLLESLNNRDYPGRPGRRPDLRHRVILVNLRVDLLYAWLDPRIRYS